MLRRSILALAMTVTAACSGTAPTAPTGPPTSSAGPPTSSAGTPTPGATDTPASPAGYAGESWQATAQSFAGRTGERFTYLCPPDGVNWFIYGTDIYTSDSSVCTAAVHMGLITLASGGVVMIEMRLGQAAYESSSRNDISSQSYGPWEASYVFVGPTGEVLAPATPVVSATPTGALPTGAVPELAQELLSPGVLTICMPFDRVLFAERDSSGEPFGVDVEIGQELALRLQLEPFIQDVAFELLIDELRMGHCDVTIGGQFITAARLELMDMIPYRQGTQHVVVKDGNPHGIDALADLCGLTVAVIQGTVHAEMLHGTGEYEGRGINQSCLSAGSDINVAEYPDEAAAEGALLNGDADAYIGNDFITQERPNEFDLSVPLLPVKNGIAHRLGLAHLDAALRGALRAIITDGTYDAILDRYSVTQVRLTELP